MSRPLLLALTVFVLAVVGVIASAVLLLPEDAQDDETPSGLTGTPVVNPTPAFPDILTPRPTQDPVRNVPEVTLFDVTTGQALPLWQTDLVVRQVEFAPDGRWMYYVTLPNRQDIDSANLYRMDLTNPQAQPEQIDRGYGMRISSTSHVAYLSIRGKEDFLPVVLAADGSHHDLAPGRGGRVFVWSPDGRWLAYSGAYESGAPTYPEYLVDTITWEQRPYTEAVPCQCDGNPVPMWSPDSTRFTYTQLIPSGEISLLFDAATLTSVPSPRNEGWIDAGSYVASRNNGSAIEFFTYNVATGAETELPGPTYPSPDGSLMATITGGEQDARTTVVTVDETTIANGLEGGFGAWSNDSSLLMTSAKASSCGPALLIHRVRGGGQMLCRATPGFTSAVMSPDSRLLALFSEPAGLRRTSAFIGTLTLVDLSTGAETVLSNDIRGFGGACLKWSPDSRFVVVGVCEGI